jgi:hypothetical protein
MWHIAMKKRMMDIWPLKAYERFLLETAPATEKEGPGFRIDGIGGKGHPRYRPFGVVFHNDKAEHHPFSRLLRKRFVPGAGIML